LLQGLRAIAAGVVIKKMIGCTLLFDKNQEIYVTKMKIGL